MTAAPVSNSKLVASGIRKVFHDKRRGDVVAIDRLDLDVREGEFVSIVGPSGCGKSTFLYMVGGFVDATAGQLRIDGTPITGPSPDRGIVFQEFGLFPWKTVLGNVAYGLRERGLSRTARHEEARRFLDLVGLAGTERRYPRELSGGMKQRVAIARTLAMDPSMLLMDEPFGALDAQTRAVLQTELLDIWERSRTTVLFVTHSVEEAILLSDRVHVLSGRPATLAATIDVDIERPRSLDRLVHHPRFAELHQQIWDLLGDIHR